MPMNADLMGASIASAVTGLSEVEKASPEAIWKAVAQVIIAHIASNAVVTTNGSATTQIGTIA